MQATLLGDAFKLLAGAITPCLLVGATVVAQPAKALNTGQINPIVLIDPLTNIDPSSAGDFQVGTNPVPSFGNGNFSFGFDFEVVNPITVNALGVFDAGGTGAFNVDHTAYLWNSDDINNPNLLASSVFSAGDCSVVTDNFCWQAINPIELSPGFYTTAATGGWQAGEDGMAVGGNVIDTTADAFWIFPVFSEDGVEPSYPFPEVVAVSGNDDPSGFAYVIPVWGSNVSIAEPVPGPLPLLGAAAAMGWSRRLRRRLKSSRAE
jgi:hypothetical protein